MSLVEPKLGYKYGIACQLVEIVEQGHCSVVYHEEDVQIRGIMADGGLVGLALSEIVGTWCKGVPHDTISASAPEERCGTGDSSVYPVVGVAYVDGLTFVTEPSVLYTAAIEPVVGTLLQSHAHVASGKIGGRGLSDNLLAVIRNEQFSIVSDRNPQVSYADGVTLQGQTFHLAAWVVCQNLCRRIGLGVADDTSLGILEQAEDMGSVEVDVEILLVFQMNLHGGGIHPCKLLCRGYQGDGQQQGGDDNLLHVFVGWSHDYAYTCTIHIYRCIEGMLLHANIQ